LAYQCYVPEVPASSVAPSDSGRWYTILKYAKSIFSRELQDQGEKPQRSNFRITLAVLLLVTSGLALPLSTLGVATVTASSAPMAGSAVLQPDGQFHAKFVFDGVASVFVVAPPSAIGSHQADEFAAFQARAQSNGQWTKIVFSRSSDIIVVNYIHIQRLAFISGSPAELGQGAWAQGPWQSNGAALGAGSMGGLMLVPTPPSAVSSVTAAVPKIWWDFFQRRSKFEIYVEILELMKRGPMTPFEVAFYARLNHKRTKEYTEFLAEAGYLQPANEEGRALYALTKEGLGFLDRVQSLLVAPGIMEVTNPAYQRDF